MKMSIYRRVLLVTVLAATFALRGFADSPSVTAVLRNSEAVVGQMVAMEIKVTGGTHVRAANEISVDGLEIHRTGEVHESQLTFGFGSKEDSSSTVYSYTILPTRAGTFTIPPQTIRVGNQSLQTPELTLHVNDAPGRLSASQSNRSSGAIDTSKLVFAELIVPKKSAFVGEMVPIEVRLGFDPRARPKLVDGPEISGQGFTAQKLQQSGENLATINGKSYDVVTFKSAVAAARAGKFEIGPVKAKAQVSIARRPGTSRSRSPFDLFSLDDPFSDPFFADPFGRLAERREVDMQSEAVEFEVKSLPPNPPPGFTGAVGNFALTTEAKPTTVQVGDPITVRSTINGRGNFDRVNAPELEDDHGWHKYPPSSNFKQDDDVGISGVKTFETVISPNEKKTAVPPFVFAYFDPQKEKYVSVSSQPVAINVSGGAAPVPASSTAASQPGSPTPATAVAQQSPKRQDILYQLTDRGRIGSFAPIFAGRGFWFAQILPLLALLGFIAWKIRQRRLDDRQAGRIAALQQESTHLLRKLRRGDLSPQEYFSDAARAVRVKTALAKNLEPSAVDAEVAAAAFALNDNSRAQLRRLFERNDELRYSGRPNGAETIQGEDRQEILDLIESLRA
jgi:hypothetical protein